MGTRILDDNDNEFTAFKERDPIIKRWKSWTISGRGGDDTLTGGPRNDRIFGDDGNDLIKGLGGNDYLEGNRGNDILAGGDGNDTLTGYGGSTGESDFLGGEGGADTFVLGDTRGVFYKGNGQALIADFDRRQGDRFQVSGNPREYSLTFSNVIGSSDLDTEIRHNGDLIVIVQDTTAVSLLADFNFV